MEEALPRPMPVRGLVERARDWVAWFGLSRLLVSAVAVIIVCVGAFWLVRTSPPPAESGLPRVAAAAPPGVTLPPPATAAGALRDPGDDSVEVTVHVAGAVQRPGVYVLDGGDRVHVAIERAGGITSVGDSDGLNLAALVADGSRIYVPAEGEVVAVFASDAAGEPAPTGPLDINRATAAQLETLPGVGPATSTAIVTERERNGPFLNVDELERVPGIGPAKLASIRDLVTA